MSRKDNTKFWMWYRRIPIMCMMVLLALSLAFQHLPAALMRAWFYPVYYAEAIELASNTYQINQNLICAMIKCESNWETDAKSAAGAEGLMQMMPDTARDLAERGFINSSIWSSNNLFDPKTNIMYGCCYLAQLLKQTNSEDEAIAAYNAGPSVASSWADKAEAVINGNFLDAIQYPETKNYVKRVRTAEIKYQELYPEGLNT